MKLILARNAHGNIDFPTTLQDRQRYQVLTVGGVCVYGKTTWDTLPPAARRNRKSIVLRQNLTDTFAEGEKEAGGGFMYDTLMNVVRSNLALRPDLWICGGKKIYDAVIHTPEYSRKITHVYLSTFPSIEGGSLTVLMPEGEWDTICLQKFSDHEFTILRRK